MNTEEKDRLSIAHLVCVADLAQAAGDHACPSSIPYMARGTATSPGAHSTS